MWSYNYSNQEQDLMHYGVLGMKWGIRRYQNPDGSLTPLGLKKKRKLEEKYEKITGKKIQVNNSTEPPRDSSNSQSNVNTAKNQNENKTTSTQSGSTEKNRNVKTMTNSELNALIERKKLENLYYSYYPKQENKGKVIVVKFLSNYVAPTAMGIGKDVLDKQVRKALGLNKKRSTIDILREEVDILENKLKKDKFESKLKRSKEYYDLVTEFEIIDNEKKIKDIRQKL